MLSRMGFFCTLMSVVLCLPAAGAQEAQEEDYVLIQARSIQGDGAYSNSLELIIDGTFADDARPWNEDQCVYWEDEMAFFILDLGAEFLIVDILLQVDDDDIYTIEYSLDGLNFVPLHVFYPGYGETGAGLDTMSSNPENPDYASLPEKDPVEGRYIRLSASSGDRRYALAELQVFGYPLAEEETEENWAVTPDGILGFGTFSRDASLIIDGFTPAEGGVWEDDGAVYWEDTEVYFVVDLGRAHEVTAIQIQVNTGGRYRIDYSLNDREYISLVEIAGAVGDIGSGMDTISTLPTDPEYVIDLDFFPVEARFLKIYAVEGGGPYAVSELQVYAVERQGRY